jgi:disulfide bond formation protein DsbB
MQNIEGNLHVMGLAKGGFGGKATDHVRALGLIGAVFAVLAFIALLVSALFMSFRAMNAEPGVRKFYYL